MSPSDGDRADRARSVIVAVVAEAVREAGAAGVVLAAPPGAERDLLGEWLNGSAAGRLHLVDEAHVERVAGVLGGDGGESVDLRPAARTALARASAVEEDLLVASGLTKTRLLLDGPEPADIHPLGDVWASSVAAWRGRARPPRAFPDPARLGALDRALRSWLEEGRPLEEALVHLPAEERTRLERLLRRPVRGGRPPVVPKLTRWTPGVDPPV